MNDLNERLRCATTSEYFGREGRMTGHERDFFGRKPARFQEHLIGNADLADVVQQRGDFEQVARFVVQLHDGRPGAAAQRDAQ